MATPVEYRPVRRRVRWGHVARRAIERSSGTHTSGTRNGLRRGYTFVPSAIEGLGQVSPWELSSPSMVLWRRGMGAPPADPPTPAETAVSEGVVAPLAFGLSAVALAAIVAVAVVVNYQLGKAMAPNEASEPKWAWGNAIGGTLFPPFTLGMAVYKNYIR